MFSNKDIVNHIWHNKVEDGGSWEFCTGLLNENFSVKMSSEEVKKQFENYFEDTTGIKPYAKCPQCKSKLTPRKSKYGYFVGCSSFPKCKFTATSSKPYL